MAPLIWALACSKGGLTSRRMHVSLVVKRSESNDAGTFFIRPSLSCCSHLCSSSDSKID